MIDQYRKLKGKEKDKLRNELLKDLFNAITEDDVLRYEGGKFYVGENVLPENDKMDIVGGAKSIQDMYVWKQIIKDAKYQANKMMYDNSTSVDDIIFAKAMLFAVNVLESKLSNLSKVK